MSIFDMDVTARRDPSYVRSRDFATVRKGYDPDQVRSFLDIVATWLDDLETELATARAEAVRRAAPQLPPPAAEAKPEADQYAVLGSRVAEVLRTAEEHGQRIRQDAEEEVQRSLDEARQESIRLRQHAQEEAEAMRQSAQDHAEATRRSAQEEADRVRDEAAHALENARVEAERTVAGLSERRNVLAAELHATRSRLMGIVSQLEEEQEGQAEPAVLESSLPLGPTLPDDPRGDPVPPEIPAFAPPPTPARVSIPDSDAEVEPPQEADGEENAGLEAELAAIDASGEDAAEVDVPDGAGTGPVAIEPPPAIETTVFPAGPAAEPDKPDDSEIEEGEGAEQPRDSFLQWTREEADGDGPSDMSLPDFPSIDIPTLEDE